ncbi:hypothetical protein BDR07DRAFT_17723 [Suillus spraguei]|nr:hypothetical protein BDR07DRAFT_17723 [Suillus spraguei]
MGNNKTWRKWRADSLAAWRASKKAKGQNQNNENFENTASAPIFIAKDFTHAPESTTQVQVPLGDMINCATRLFVRLNGTRAAWAIKKYRGHRVLPPTIMQEFDAH